MSGGSLKAARQLLKVGNKFCKSETGLKGWRYLMLSEFRKHKGEKDKNKLKQLHAVADNYSILIDNIARHRHLIYKYNVLAQQRKAIEMSAKVSGLDLPPWPEEYEAHLAKEVAKNKVIQENTQQEESKEYDVIEDKLRSRTRKTKSPTGSKKAKEGEENKAQPENTQQEGPKDDDVIEDKPKSRKIKVLKSPTGSENIHKKSANLAKEAEDKQENSERDEKEK